MHTLYDVIKRPIVSEKSTALAEVANRYVFEVAPQAKKEQIKDAVEKLFNVKVTDVRTLINHGKFKRLRGAVIKKPNKKKAIVSLAEGQKIDFYQAK